MDTSMSSLSFDEADFCSSSPGLSGTHDASPRTFAHLLASLQADTSISAKQRRDEHSALRTLLRSLNCRPEDLEIRGDERELERILKSLAGSAARLKGANLRNIRSRCRNAYGRFVAQAGMIVRAPEVLVIPPYWVEMAGALSHRTAFSPKRFIRFTVRLGLTPAAVNDAVIERYGATLADLKHPRPHLAQLIKVWNTLAAADPQRGLRALSPREAARSSYSVKLGELHPRLRADIEGYFAERSQPRARSIRKRCLPPLKPSSAGKGLQLVRQYLGVLQQEQIDVARFESLADAVTLDHLERAADVLLDRSGEEPSSQLHNMLCMLSGIARHWTGMTPKDLETLADWISGARPTYDGMVARNVERLLVLQDRRNRGALLGLPFQLMKLAQQSDSERGAYLAQKAVAIELLPQTAMRIGNLSRLRFDKHIVQSAIGRDSAMFVLVEGDEVKNGEQIRVELPPDCAKLLRTYRETFLPRLRNGGDGLLFPGEGGRSKNVSTFSHQIKAVLKEHTGLNIHPHLFRSIAVFIYLEHHPGDLLTMQRVLGDRSLAVIQKHYSFLDQMKARKSHQDAVIADRAMLRVRPGRQQGGRR